MTKRGQTVAGYSVQIVVDSKNKIIVGEDVTQDGNDTQLLAPILEKAQEVLKADKLTGLGILATIMGLSLKSVKSRR